MYIWGCLKIACSYVHCWLSHSIPINVVPMHSSKSHKIHISTSIFYPFKGTKWHDLLKSSWEVINVINFHHFYDQKDFYIITYNSIYIYTCIYIYVYIIYSKSHAIPIKSPWNPRSPTPAGSTRFRASSTETCALGGWSAAAPPTPPRTMPSAPPWKRRTSAISGAPVR